MQKIEYASIDSLRNHPENPRKIDEHQIEILCKSLKDNPDYFETRPILANKDGIVFAGNMRLLAARKIGLKKVPVAFMDISEERQREIMIRDNRQNGSWDFDILSSHFDMPELTDWGFSDMELTGATVDFGLGEDDNAETDKARKETPKTCPNCGYELENGVK